MTVAREKELLKGVQEGDLVAFGHIYEAYFEQLCNFAFLYTKDRETATDIVSDLFADLWYKAGKIRIKASLKSYLYRSTRNAVIDHLRTLRPSRSLDHGSGTDREKYQEQLQEHAQGRVQDPGPETLLLKKEFTNQVHSLLDTLPPRSALVLRMKKLDGLSYREISEILGISERTIENHIATAIRKLRELLRENPELRAYLQKID